jgi:hypothetical protein
MKLNNFQVKFFQLILLCFPLAFILFATSDDTVFLIDSLSYSCSSLTSFRSVVLALWSLHSCFGSSLILAFNLLLLLRLLHIVSKRVPPHLSTLLILPLLPSISHLLTLNKYLVTFFCISEILNFYLTCKRYTIRYYFRTPKQILLLIYISVVLRELYLIQPGSIILLALPFFLLFLIRRLSSITIRITSKLANNLLIIISILILPVLFLSLPYLSQGVASTYLLTTDSSAFSVTGISTQQSVFGFFVRIIANYALTPILAIFQFPTLSYDSQIIAIANTSPLLFTIVNQKDIRLTFNSYKRNPHYILFFMTLSVLSVVPFVQTRYLLPFTPLLLMSKD